MIIPRVSRSFGDYPSTLIDAPVGCRVQISPGCDLWMRGARYGVITGAKIDKHGREVVSVRMYNKAVKRLQWFFPIDLTVAR
jgi:hypothetical protein